MMEKGTYLLERTTMLPVSREEAWSFFSDPANLATITPPEMAFEIRTQLNPGEFKEGMYIRYLVRPVAGIPMTWISKIRDITEGKAFTDEQIEGPYASWIHTHEFEAFEGGTRMRDAVRYRLPLGILGRIAHAVFVRRKLESIFDYREKVIRRIFQ